MSDYEERTYDRVVGYEKRIHELEQDLRAADRALIHLMDAQGLSTDGRRYVVRHVAPTVADAREREAARKETP